MEQEIYSHPRAYDLLYQWIDYEAEVAFVLDRSEQRGVEEGSALIVGCGTGNHARHLTRHDFDVVGVDPQIEMLERARKKSNARFAVDSLPDLDVEDEFELVWAPYNVVQYLDEDELHSGLRSLANVVAESGVLVFDLGEIRPMESPDFRISADEDATCAHLTQTHRIAENRVQRNTIFFVGDDWFFDQHTLSNFDLATVEEALRNLEFDVRTYEGYGKMSKYDETVFVASKR